ncbi:MAG: hypothetical protein H0X34_18155, partial [Chthoniobacterales bacterium]|nr:hypothetical protein [Chthoniobacterales bacterium]
MSTAPVTPIQPAGIAVDPAAGRLYWADVGTNKIGYANLNGSGGGYLSTSPVTPSDPRGIAADPGTGRVYWTNSGGNTIGYANLDGSGGGGGG